jgi:hypothetical protein
MKPAALNPSPPPAEPAWPGLARADLLSLVDALIDAYVSWREESSAVAMAYEYWSIAARADRRLAYSGYVAALDREEKAATMYRGLVEQIADVHGALSACARQAGGPQRGAGLGVVPWSPRSIARRIRRR